MKRVQVSVYDDVDYAEDRKLTPATKTVRIGLGGEWRELDLGEENAEQFAEDIGRYWEAAQPEGAPMEPEGKRNSSERRSYFAGLREWAKEQGRNSEVRRLPSGGFKYATALRRDYAAHLLAQPQA